MSNWNRIYRPKKVSELHLEVVKQQLQTFMNEGVIPQAMLFAGPKGTGKTSASRILGAILNEPQNKKGDKLKDADESNPLISRILSGSSFVVQELDAASNRGIDDVRALKERVFLPPQEGDASVFILDEAHMLTAEAFNALLKLLEEPPSHAHFILATTELHKIPATIVSRCQVVHFHKATQAELIVALERVLKAEKIDFEHEAIEAIAQHADGSFRDAIKVAELVTVAGKLTKKMVEESSLGTFQSEIVDLVKALLAKDEVAITSIFEELRSRSVNAQFFFKRIMDAIHLSLLQNLEVKPGEPFVSLKVAQFLLKELSQVEMSKSSPIPHLPLELKLLEIVSRSEKKNPEKITQKPSFNQSPTSSMGKKKDLKTEVVVTDKILAVGDGALLCDRWEDLVKLVARKNVTVAALLRSAQPIGGEIGQAKVGVYYTFHQEQLSQPKIVQMLDSCINDIAGGSLVIDFVLSDQPKSADLIDNQHTQELARVASEVLM